MLHLAVKVTERSEIEGKGLVAACLIEQGEVIWQPDPDEARLCLVEILAWPEARQIEFNKPGWQQQYGRHLPDYVLRAIVYGKAE
jgi:hypothetical protein